MEYTGTANGSENSSASRALGRLGERITEQDRKISELEGKIAELERKIAGTDSESSTERAQETSANDGSNNWTYVTFERRQLNQSGIYSTEPTKKINELLGGHCMGSKDKPISILLDDQDEGVHIFIEKTANDPWLFRTFFKEIPELQRYQNVEIDNAYIRISAPYAPLFHNKQLLKDKSARLGSDSQSNKEQLDELLKLYQYDWFKKYHDREIQETVEFSDLWKLYPPDSLVVVRALREHKVVRRLVSTQMPDKEEEKHLRDPQIFLIVYSEVSHDGKGFGERELTVGQRIFSGSKRISELEACPWEFYHEERDQLENDLVVRGGKWYRLCEEKKIMHMMYSGNCVPLSKVTEFVRSYDLEDIKERGTGTIVEDEVLMSTLSGQVVIIDPDAHTKAPQILSILYSLVRGGSGISWDDNDKKKKQFLRSPAVIPVFSLDEDQWVLVAVKDIQEPLWPDMWNRLKYPAADKPKLTV